MEGTIGWPIWWVSRKYLLRFHPAYFAGSAFLFLPNTSPTAISSKLNVTRTQFRTLIRLAQFPSPPGLSDGFSATRKCHAAHDTALVRRWMNGVEPGWGGFETFATVVVCLSSLFGERVIGPLRLFFDILPETPWL